MIALNGQMVVRGIFIGCFPGAEVFGMRRAVREYSHIITEVRL